MAYKKMLQLTWPIKTTEQITVSTAVKSLTSSYIKKGGALITLEGGSIRWRADGTDPTSEVGHLMTEGDSLTIVGDSTTARTIRFIRTGDLDGILTVSHRG